MESEMLKLGQVFRTVQLAQYEADYQAGQLDKTLPFDCTACCMMG
jgi:hypothetical protein